MQECNQRRRGRRMWRGAVIALLLLALIAAAVWGVHLWEESRTPAEPSGDGAPHLTTHRGGALFELRDDMETLLVIGLDQFESQLQNAGDGYRNQQQADFLMLVLIDRTNRQCQLIHINRDTMSSVPILGVMGDVAGTQVEQLALSHTYGTGKEDSCRNTVRAVSTFLHETPIDHYVALTMDAVAVLNDAVGGVEVEVLDDFSGVDKSLVKGQKVTLRGQQALTYVRSRRGMEEQTNTNRMARQRQYLDALRLKLTDKIRGDGGFSLETALNLSAYMTSDCSVNRLADIADRVAEYGFSDILTIAGESVQGEEFMEFYADDEALQSMILDLFYRPVESSS